MGHATPPLPDASSLIEAMPLGVAMADVHGRLLLVNAELARMTGYAVSELIGQPVEVLLPESTRELHVGERIRYATSPVPRPMGAGRQLWARRKDGSTFPVEVGLHPLRCGDQDTVLACLIDRTEVTPQPDDEHRTTGAAPHPALPPDWPTIDGIDAIEVRQRMAGDRRMFLTLLRQLFQRFRDLSALVPSTTPLSAIRARMHDLKGSSGMLSARALREIASRAEAAAHAGDDAAARLALTLAIEALAQLEQRAQAHLHARSTSDAVGAHTAASAMDVLALQRLTLALRSNDLSALDEFQSIASALQQRMGRTEFQALEDALHALEFTKALALLHAYIDERSDTP